MPAFLPLGIKRAEARRWALMLVNAAIVLVIIVVMMGGWTRINDAGLSCPDWPGCFGQLTVPVSASQLDIAAQLYPGVEVVAGKSWLEMIHRYLAASLALLIFGLTLIALYLRSETQYPQILSLSLLLLVVFQAVLGMWTVTLKLLPVVVTAHLFGGLLTTVLLVLLRDKILMVQARGQRWTKANYLLLLGLVLLCLQILLGGWTSSHYAAWGCSDWLRCNPTLDIDYNFSAAFSINLDSSYSHQGGTLALAERGAIQITHRVGAVLVTSYFLWLYFAVARYQFWARRCRVLILLLAMQILLGLMTVAWMVPTLLAMAHHMVAVALLVYTTRVLSVSVMEDKEKLND